MQEVAKKKKKVPVLCLNPLRGFQTDVYPSGKPKYTIVSRETNSVFWDGHSWRGSPRPDMVSSGGKPAVRDYIMIPCGHCMECRLQHSREWATRMMLEAQYHVDNYFVTLTYDDSSVPISHFLDYDTGEVLPAQTLRKEHLQLFFKRLRRRLDYYYSSHFRYYAAGEYGDSTHRPHYHFIGFGLYLPDLVQLKTSRLGNPYYTSELLQSCWPYGFSMVAPVTWQSCAYVARYCTKKIGGIDKSFYDLFHIEEEFAVMSRRPGIAKQYFDEHADEIYKMDEIFLALTDGGKKVKPPHYFDALYEQIDSEQLQLVKEQRMRYKQSSDQQQRRRSDLSDDERLEIRAAQLMRRAQALIRPDC